MQLLDILEDVQRIYGEGFNTASGRHCCNKRREELKKARAFCAVSIPQAVGTVATAKRKELNEHKVVVVSIPQAVGTVATAGSRKPVFMRFQKLVLENLKP